VVNPGYLITGEVTGIWDRGVCGFAGKGFVEGEERGFVFHD
jgi:hypothetical protein